MRIGVSAQNQVNPRSTPKNRLSKLGSYASDITGHIEFDENTQCRSLRSKDDRKVSDGKTFRSWAATLNLTMHTVNK